MRIEKKNLINIKKKHEKVIVINQNDGICG